MAELPKVAADVTTPVVEVGVDTTGATFCGKCRPDAMAVAFDLLRGYVCPKHGDQP